MQPVLSISVEFMGPFEFDFGEASTEVTLTAPATVATLLRALARRWPAARQLWTALAATSPRRRYVSVSLDYTMLAPDAVLDAPLHDGARVCFGMPMVGG
jgi:hypothetical protein